MDATVSQRPLLGGIKLDRVRRWCLRTAAVSRLVVLAMTGVSLWRSGGAGVALVCTLIVSAIGIWFRRPWPWRAALLTDIVVVVFFAVKLIDSNDLQLFCTISGAAVLDVVLLGAGQGALARPQPPQYDQ